MVAPFRWDISKREQLGRLLEGPRAGIYRGFLWDLEDCCSRILAFCDDSDLVFIGRSPESIFDYLSGVLGATTWSDRCSLLNLSFNRYCPCVDNERPGAIRALRRQLSELGLDPVTLARRERPAAFVDVVWRGYTMENLFEVLVRWGREIRADVPSVKRKIRVVGLTPRMKTSPNAFRWQQHDEFIKPPPSRLIKNVSLPERLYFYLAQDQKKVQNGNPFWLWGQEEMSIPPRSDERLEALRLAAALYELGSMRESRLALARIMVSEPAMCESWFRALVTELRRRKSL